MLYLTSASFPNYGLDRFFRIAAHLQFDGVEIMVCDDFDTQDPVYLKELSERYKIPIKLFSLPIVNPGKYVEAFEKVVREFPNTTINLAPPETLASNYKKWMETMAPKLAQVNKLQFNRRNVEFKVRFGFLPSHTESSLHSLRESGDVSLDLCALWKIQEDVIRATNLLALKLKHVYLGNVYQGQTYTSLTHGLLPVESLLTKLARENFSGEFTLKLSPKSLHEGNGEKMLAVLKESKDFFEKYFRAD